MTTAYVTPARRVDLVEVPGWIEALEPGTGRLLGVAALSRTQEWSGWLVQVGDRREAALDGPAARVLLEQLAGQALAAGVKP